MTNPSVPERNFNIVVITGGLLEAHPAYTAVELEQLPARQMRFWVQGHEILAAHLVGHLAQAGPHCTDAATDPGGVRSIWRVAGGQVRDRSGASRDSRAGVLGLPSRRRHEAAFEPEQRIAAVPGVRHIYPITFIGATYQRPTQQVIMLPTDFDAGWAGNLNAQASPDAIAALAHSRTGALISTALEAQYHWKVGDQIPLLTRLPRKDGSMTWTFQVVGTYRGPDSGAMDHFIVVRNDYFQQARQSDQNTVSQYILDVTDAAQGEQIARRIDALSANSSFPTRTQSTRATSQSGYRRLGDLNFVVHAIVSAAMFALLIATAALTMQSVREWTTELAVLKTMG